MSVQSLKPNGLNRKRNFIFSIVLALLPLIFYRFIYSHFTNFEFNSFEFQHTTTLSNITKLFIPIGLTYQTYMSLSYIIDVYKLKEVGSNSIITNFLYVSFFPQIFLGPLSKYREISEQLEKEKLFNYQQAIDGVGLIVLGVFKKIVVCENLYRFYSEMFFQPFPRTDRFILFILTPIYLYCDFSSFIDIARGVSKLFGINLYQNFKAPLIQKSVGDFWSKWHVSLYRFMRDYVFYPLLSIKKDFYYVVLWIFVVFSLSSVAHGNESKFFFMGILAASFYSLELLNSKYKLLRAKKYPLFISTFFQHFYAYLAFSCLTLCYISPNVMMYFKFLKSLFINNSTDFYFLNFTNKEIISTLLGIVIVSFDHSSDNIKSFFCRGNFLKQWSVILILILFIIIFFHTDLRPFIYFYS